MPVVRSTPATWQGRAPEALAARLEVERRARAFYRTLAERTPRLFDGIRALGPRWRARMDKARSETQSPSALERLLEDVVILKLAGASTPELRQIEVVLHRFITDLDDAPPSEARALAALHATNAGQVDEQLAESLLLTRAHRRLDVPDLRRLVAATEQMVARATEQLVAFSALLRAKEQAAHGLVAVRGGQPS